VAPGSNAHWVWQRAGFTQACGGNGVVGAGGAETAGGGAGVAGAGVAPALGAGIGGVAGPGAAAGGGGLVAQRVPATIRKTKVGRGRRQAAGEGARVG
jgi:hypothetical protein